MCWKTAPCPEPLRMLTIFPIPTASDRNNQSKQADQDSDAGPSQPGKLSINLYDLCNPEMFQGRA
eukprot:scaffold346485_cov17-Prasinocladus_malaysianus.AAC.1